MEWPEALCCISGKTVGSSGLSNSCANIVNPSWRMSQVLHHCSSFGASIFDKATNDEERLLGRSRQFYIHQARRGLDHVNKASVKHAQCA